MIDNIIYSLQKYLKGHNVDVVIDNSDGQMKDDFITLSQISPEEIVVGNNYSKQEYRFLIYLYDTNKHSLWRKIDTYLECKEVSEQPFTVYNLSTGQAVKDYDCTISMPDNIIFKTPFGNSIVDDIIITVRRKR